MLYFQVQPDRVFLAIPHESLTQTREGLDFAPAYTPTDEDHKEMDEHYRELFPELTRFFDRKELLEVLDRLVEASQQPAIYEITDDHWLVVDLESICSFLRTVTTSGFRQPDVGGRDGGVGLAGISLPRRRIVPSVPATPTQYTRRRYPSMNKAINKAVIFTLVALVSVAGAVHPTR